MTDTPTIVPQEVLQFRAACRHYILLTEQYSAHRVYDMCAGNSYCESDSTRAGMQQAHGMERKIRSSDLQRDAALADVSSIKDFALEARHSTVA